jgi:cyanophycinase
MIAFGAGGSTPKQRMSKLSAGLGLARGVMIDQHFEQRNRYGRLLSLVAQSRLLGLGVEMRTRPPSFTMDAGRQSSAEVLSRWSMGSN